MRIPTPRHDRRCSEWRKEYGDECRTCHVMRFKIRGKQCEIQLRSCHYEGRSSWDEGTREWIQKATGYLMVTKRGAIKLRDSFVGRHIGNCHAHWRIRTAGIFPDALRVEIYCVRDLLATWMRGFRWNGYEKCSHCRRRLRPSQLARLRKPRNRVVFLCPECLGRARRLQQWRKTEALKLKLANGRLRQIRRLIKSRANPAA